MLRSVLALLVCLCLQMSAASAPLVHVHADADHETDHHDGHVVHSHLTLHVASAGHDHGDREAMAPSNSEGSAVVIGSSEAGSFGLGAPMVQGQGVARLLMALPQSETGLPTPQDPGAIPPDKTYWRPSSPPGPSSFALRGPPR